MAGPIIIYKQVGTLYVAGYTADIDHQTAQEFIAQADFSITKVTITFSARDWAVDSATVYMYIQGVGEDDKPDGNTLASESKSISIPYNEELEVDFVLSSPLAVTFNQKYFIVVAGDFPNARNYLDLRVRGDFYYPITDGLFRSTDGGATWGSRSSDLRMGYQLWGELVPPVVTTDSAVYELYMGWEGWESIKWGVTLVQRIIYTDKRLGVCYSKINETPTIEDSLDTNRDYYSDGVSLTNEWIYFATPGATYYVRAICYYLGTYNPDEYPDLVGYGEVIEVVIPPRGPTVTTQACTNVTGNSATGNGTITDIGGENPHTRGFCYMEGTSGNPTTANSKVYDTGSFGTGAFSKTIPNLSPGTNYRVRAYAINSDGTGYGATVQLTTDTPPTVTTQAVTEITHNTAIGNGNITATGGEIVTKRGICWNTTGNPTIADNKSEEIGSFDVGAFTRPITGLSENITYYVKAYAYNSVGYGYGAQVDFTTTPVPAAPVVTTQAVTDIEIRTATANGTIVSGVEIFERGFEYGLTETPTNSVKEEGIDLGLGPYSLPLTEL